MTAWPAALAAHEALAERLAPALEASGFSLTRLAPEEAQPSILRTFGSRLLILESDTAFPLESLQPYWDELPLDQHLPILLLEPPGTPAFRLEDVDEPLDRATTLAEPGEVAARALGLLRERTIRIYRRAFHDLSQPLTIARAYSQRVLKLVAAGDPARGTLEELDRQVERIFRTAEDLQKRRME
jgi:signal transduction histidine kinase